MLFFSASGQRMVCNLPIKSARFEICEHVLGTFESEAFGDAVDNLE
jgi:hypothetical protein